MTDTIFLRGMAFEGRHGVSDEERAEPQVIEVDIDVALDLRAAEKSDDLARTVDYAEVFEVCRAHAEQHSYRLLEALAGAIARSVLDRFASVDWTAVTVRKPGVPIDGVLEYAGVRVERGRETGTQAGRPPG